MTALPPPLLPALVAQIMAGHIYTNDVADEKRRARMGVMLVALLDQSMPLQMLKKAANCSDRTTRDDTTLMIDNGLLTTWTARGIGNATVVRWYGLTPAGVSRAKRLKEMSE